MTTRATFSRSLRCNQAKGGRWRSLGESLLQDCVGEIKFVSVAEGGGVDLLNEIIYGILLDTGSNVSKSFVSVI